MININNRIISMNNVTIIGGQHSSRYGTDKMKSFDERKFEDSSKVDEIVIDSLVFDINIMPSSSSKIEAHMYGQSDIDGDINFDVHTVNRELIITANCTGSCFNGNLTLDILVPSKTFRAITAKASAADITLDKGVSADYLRVETAAGDLESNANFTKASISSKSGDVELYINAKKDISVEISTLSGDVSAEFDNISHIDLSSISMNGSVKNCHKGKIGYQANVKISTMCGDIKIQ